MIATEPASTPSQPLCDWQTVFRDGLAPALGRAGLEALRDALASDSPDLIQWHTALAKGEVSAPGHESRSPGHDREPCGSACAVGLALWRAAGLQTVGQVQDAFRVLNERAHALLLERHGQDVREIGNTRSRHMRFHCCQLYAFWDLTPRRAAVRQLLAEVELALAGEATT